MKRLFACPVIAIAMLSAIGAFAQQKMDDMKGMDMSKKQSATTPASHTAVGTVKKVDAKAGTVMLDREPVKSLNWPAMTMGFKVADKSLLDKLSEGKKVEVEFKQMGKDYVITSVK